MTSNASRSRFIYLAAVVLVSAHFSIAYLTGTHSYVDIVKYTHGNERTPFQYRALTAWLTRGLAGLSTTRWVAAQAPEPLGKSEVISWLALTMASMMLLLESTRRTTAQFARSPLVPLIAPFIAAAAAYVSFVALASTYRYSYPYDLPSLALFSVSTYLLLQNRMVAFYGLFILSTLTRETSLLLVFTLACYRWSRGKGLSRRNLVHVAALVCIWTGIKAWLHWLYAGNPVEPAHSFSTANRIVIFQFRENIQNLLKPIYWPGILSAAGWLWLIVFCYRSKIADAALRRSALWIVPVCGLLMLSVGRITEVRVFAECIPLLVAGAAAILDNTLAAGKACPVSSQGQPPS